MKLGGHGPNQRTSGPRAQIMRKSIFTPNRNFHEIGCSRPKSTQKRSPSSDHEKINFYGRIAIFMKLGAHGRNRRTSGSPSSDHEKINFYGRIAIFMKLGAHGRNRRTSGPRAQIMRKSIFTPNRNFHEIGCSRPKSTHKRSRAQIMRKSIFTAESQFS